MAPTKEVIKSEKDIGLIESVRVHPLLYNLGDKDYRNNNKKVTIWEGIAQENGFDSKSLLLLFCIFLKSKIID